MILLPGHAPPLRTPLDGGTILALLAEMPELPEVEIVCRGLAPSMEGAAFSDVLLNREDLRFPFSEGFAHMLRGRRIERMRRRAKYIVADMEGGLSLAIHLGMTGRFTIRRDGQAVTPGEFYYDHGADPKHDHVVFEMTGGATIRYNDVRRFGYMTLVDTSAFATHPLFHRLGVEPLSEDLSAEYLAASARGKSVNLKSFLMDQRIVAGLGNIYVCEALFRSRLSPATRASHLSSAEGKADALRLSDAIKSVLNDALLAGGSSFRDYRHADGTSGQFQDNFQVYGRKGQPCFSGCGAAVERAIHQGRSTFFCPVCQRADAAEEI